MPVAAIKFTKGSWEELSGYEWNMRMARHCFCPTCGSGILSAFKDGSVGIVNLRSLDDVDVDALLAKAGKLDGKNNIPTVSSPSA